MIDDPMNRLKVKRGECLPHSKLTNDDVMYIREVVDKRNELKKRLSLMSNKHLSIMLGVHQRTVDKVTALETWTHI